MGFQYDAPDGRSGCGVSPG